MYSFSTCSINIATKFGDINEYVYKLQNLLIFDVLLRNMSCHFVIDLIIFFDF